MMTKDVEIEIRVGVEKGKPLLAFLKKNAKLLGTEHQIDDYFTPAHKNFLAKRPIKEWLRLRNSNGKYTINYKNWHFDKSGKSNYCDEFETLVTDVISMRKIFSALNMKFLTTVDKKREIWRYQDYEVSIDTVKGLGNFVEIEYKGNAKVSPKKITDQMLQFLKGLGCGKLSRNYQGYPFLMLFPNEAREEIQ